VHDYIAPLGANLYRVKAAVGLRGLIGQRIVRIEIVRQACEPRHERISIDRATARLRRQPLQHRDRTLTIRGRRRVFSRGGGVDGVSGQVERAGGTDHALEIRAASLPRDVARKAFADEHDG
jgi:hypothetical protein